MILSRRNNYIIYQQKATKIVSLTHGKDTGSTQLTIDKWKAWWNILQTRKCKMLMHPGKRCKAEPLLQGVCQI